MHTGKGPMKRTFVSNLLLLLAVNLLIKPFWILGVDRTVQNTLGYETYGSYYVLYVFSLLLITLLDLGINTYTASSIARNREMLQSEFPSLTVFKLISSGIYLLLTVVLGALNGYQVHLLALLAFNQVLSFFYLYFRSVVGGLQMYRTDSLLSVVDRSLMIILCSLMLWLGVAEISAERFVMAQTLSYASAVLISFMVISPHVRGLSWRFNKRLASRVLRQMLPYAGLSLIMTFYTRFDVILLEKLLPDGVYQSGIYSSAYRLLDAANMMAAMVSMLLLPMFARMIAGNQDPSSLVQFATGIMVIPAFAFGLGSFAYRQPIMELLNIQSSSFSGEVFGYLILCFVPLSSMYVYGTLLTAGARIRTLIILSTIGLLINVVLNILLIPHLKAMGAAIASLVTQIFIGFSNFYFGKRILHLHFEPAFKKNFIISILMITSVVIITKALDLPFVGGMLLTGAVTLLTLFSLKIINLKQGLQLLGSERNRDRT